MKPISSHLASSLAAIACAALAACAPMKRPDPRAEFRGRIDSLPEAWKEEPVIGLLDSVTVKFIPNPEGNRVERRETEWFYVNHRNPNVLEHIYRVDFENLEGAVDVSATAWFPDGTM